MRTDRGEARRLAWRAGLYAPPGLAVLLVVLVALAWSSLALAPDGTTVAAWWPAVAVAVLALAWAPHDRWLVVAGLYLVANVTASVLVGRHAGVALGFALSNTVEVLGLAWLLVRRTHGPRTPRLRTVEDYTTLVLGSLAVVGLMAAGTALTVALAGEQSDLFAGESPVEAARTLAAAHGAALLLLVPLGMGVAAAPPGVSRVERTAQWVLLLALTAFVFAPGHHLPLTFLPLPTLVWGAVRHGVRGVSVQLLTFGLMVVFLTRAGGGPFADHLGPWTPATLSFIETYLAAAALFSLIIAITVAEHREALGRVAASERLFRQGFSDALLGMVLLRRSAGGSALEVVELNDVAARILGRPVTESVGTSFTDALEPGARATVLAEVGLMARSQSSGWRGEVAVLADGAERWVDLSLAPLAASAGPDVFGAQVIDVSARREAQERLTALALADPLTGLANRSLLRDRIELALSTLPDGASAVVLYCDLDDFKHVNDSAGHSTGDQVLVEVAGRLRRLLHPGDVAARPGGDEFVVLRPVCHDQAQAQELAAALLAALAEPVVVDGRPVGLGVSIGIACTGRDGTADDLLRDADAAMYAAKAGGKRRAVVFADEHRAGALRSLRLLAELRTALDEDQLEVHLQPVVDLATGGTLAAEALVRWRHPERGLLPPGEWLDVAEGSGLMPELGAFVLDRSARLAAGWPVPPGGPALLVHVNVSARQLEGPGFCAMVDQVLTASGLDPRRLVLEVTETQLDVVSEVLAGDLAALRARGVGIAADDFGTGFSPLTRIIDLPVSMVKIDRRFVADMLTDARSRAVVRSVLRLADSLGLAVVAEGVETQAHAAALRELGCPAAQGYLWSRPVPPEVFTARLTDRPAAQLTDRPPASAADRPARPAGPAADRPAGRPADERVGDLSRASG